MQVQWYTPARHSHSTTATTLCLLATSIPLLTPRQPSTFNLYLLPRTQQPPLSIYPILALRYFSPAPGKHGKHPFPRAWVSRLTVPSRRQRGRQRQRPRKRGINIAATRTQPPSADASAGRSCWDTHFSSVVQSHVSVDGKARLATTAQVARAAGSQQVVVHAGRTRPDHCDHDG